jgi:mono/diheme cytochrome c family protein
VLPDQVMNFGTLYKDNCAGCHGQNGRQGAARPLNDGFILHSSAKNDCAM